VVIPPSTLAIVLAAQAGISVGKLLMTGLVPGFMLAGMFALFIVITSTINPKLTPKINETDTNLDSLFKDFLKYLLPLGLIIISVLGSILSGLATPTEASALGALTSFILAAAYGKLNKAVLLKSAKNCLELVSMIFMIAAGSVAFSQILAFTGVTRGMVTFTTSLALSPTMIIVVILAFLILMGTMIEQVSTIMICVPIFMPIANALHFDPMWFGMMMLLAITTGLLTPPFGLLLFIINGASGTKGKISDVYLAALPYLCIILLGLALILIFPGIATWLPSLM
jgi:tripartite ATP-independent transporter DctM subunit